MSNRAFGVEIECYSPIGYIDPYGDPTNGVEYTIDLLEAGNFQKWAKLTGGDESLDVLGVEIRSPILQGKEGFSELKTVMEFLCNKDYWVNSDCGFHVHLSAPEYSKNSKLIVKTVKAWMRNQHLVDNMVERYRIDNDHCPEWDASDVEYLENVLERCQTTEGTLRGSINFGSLPYHETIEIRQHEGTLDWEEAESWIKFCQAFIDSVSGTTIQRMSKEELLLKRLKVEKNASRFLTTKARINRERREV